ncbi:MAG: potassium-transporting ATPase subunit KdpC [Saprospiraceae bacterium]|nr:potassium-transporting ATPase subunit KdpC [Saprospiraceae bacterium]
MKNHILPAIKMTLISLVIFSGAYPLLMWGIAQVTSPNKGKVELVQNNGKVVGGAIVGQAFTSNRYFWGRPSAADYNAAGSAGSNKGPSNPDYLVVVQTRIDTFAMDNAIAQTSNIPADAVTASGSGLDPHLSKQAALLQISRISKARNVEEATLRRLIDEYTQGALFGLFGPKDYVNVLELNIALDNL